MEGFEQGRFANLQIATFRERLQSPWVTSEREAITHGSVRKIPIPQPKNPVHESERDFYFLPIHSYLLLQSKIGNGIFGK